VKPSGAAQAAAEAVRDLNRATLFGGYEWPGDVDAVVVALATLAQRLPQALGQAAGWLEREHDAGRVAHDTQGENVTVSVYAALMCLDNAVRHAGALAVALDQARQHTAHLRGVTS
jgi:hypothetical protein